MSSSCTAATSAAGPRLLAAASFDKNRLCIDWCRVATEDDQRELYRRHPGSRFLKVDPRFPGGDRFKTLRVFVRRSEWTPGHTLERPPLDRIATEDYSTDDLASRSAAIAAAAEANTRSMNQPAEEFITWALPIEVGEQITARSPISCELIDGLGVQELCVYNPIRLVQPTPEEIGEHARGA